MALSRSIFLLAVASAVVVAQDTPKVDAIPAKADEASKAPGAPAPTAENPKRERSGERPPRPEGFPPGPPPGERGERGDRGDGPRRGDRGDWRGHRQKLPDEQTVREEVENNLKTMTPEKRKEFWGAVSVLDKVPVEQRGDFWRAVFAVSFMPPEQKTKIIGEGEERRKVMKEEVDRVFADVGLTREDPRRREFYMRYFGGRKEVEEKILKESNERRQALLKELENSLKEEFSKPAALDVKNK